MQLIPLIPVKIGLLTFLALSGSLLGFSAASIAGPKDNFSDSCLYRYEAPPTAKVITGQHRICLTKSGRVLYAGDLDNYGLAGYLGKDHVYYIRGNYYNVKYEQVNQARNVVSYSCVSDSSGTCQGPTTKRVYEYLAPDK